MAREVPISRGLVDEAAPWLRGLLGIGFVAYSANATIFIAADDLLWLFPITRQTTIGAFPDAYWYSFLIAVVLFVGQVVTSEKYPAAYRLFLAPDILYTGRGVFGGLSTALAALALAAIGPEYREAADWFGWILAFPGAAVIGFIIARWGEVLLFGKRRTTRRTSKKDE